jgi:hypothetical protein
MTLSPAPVRIVPASDRFGIEAEGYYVVSPVGKFYRSNLESARVSARLLATANGTTVDESAIEEADVVYLRAISR